jgi:hypothetical protein
VHPSRSRGSEKAIPLKILILGGYGVFGGRLAELLSDIPSLEIIISGRNLEKARAFCAAFQGAATVRPLQLDRQQIERALRSEAPDLVIDASGPFQDYGDSGYSVVEACIGASVNYLDFADAADFVFGISKFDAAAKSAGVFGLSGVSSFPVLSAAVLRKMAATMDIFSVKGGIAPSPYAGVGLNVMRAVVGYAGAPVKLYRNGKPSTGIGLAESMRYTIAVPGRLPLKNTHFSLVDVPDLQVIPPEHAHLKDIWMGAGPVPETLHRALNLMAKFRAKFGLPSLAPLSGVFYFILNLMKFGEHRGGMFVQAEGMRDGQKIEQSWHLLAEGDDGPYIPSMAIEAIVRKYLSGAQPRAGARAATHELELGDYERLFETRTIYSGFRTGIQRTETAYRQILGAAFDRLPEQLKVFHGGGQAQRWSGHAEVKRGQGFLARTIARIIGFPEAASSVPVSVERILEGQRELWIRDFGGRKFSSVQEPGRGRNEYLLMEKFGAVKVNLALVIESDRLVLIPRRWSLLGVPMPKFLLPQGVAFETESDGCFCFDVEVSVPFVGLVVAYKGALKQDVATGPTQAA